MSQTSSNHFQAHAYQVATGRFMTRGRAARVTLRDLSRYPEVPAQYPNREVRRLVARKKFHLLPTEWREFLMPRIPQLTH